MAELKQVPQSEVLKHKTKDDLWLIIHHNGAYPSGFTSHCF
jgi:cytochrome b involved in lipid metabolism